MQHDAGLFHFQVRCREVGNSRFSGTCEGSLSSETLSLCVNWTVDDRRRLRREVERDARGAA